MPVTQEQVAQIVERIGEARMTLDLADKPLCKCVECVDARTIVWLADRLATAERERDEAADSWVLMTAEVTRLRRSLEGARELLETEGNLSVCADLEDCDPDDRFSLDDPRTHECSNEADGKPRCGQHVRFAWLRDNSVA